MIQNAINLLLESDDMLQSVDSILRKNATSVETRDLSEIRASIRRLIFRLEERIPPEPPEAA